MEDSSISIPTDSEGFYSLQCPHCKERFKTTSEDYDAEDTLELFCPSCGLAGASSSFIPKDVIEHAQIIALNYVQQEIFKSFKKTSHKMKGSGMTFHLKKPKEESPKLLTEDEDLEKVELYCCDKTIKVNIDQKVSNVYCPFCGVN
ncbi:hypothetical protein [Bacillus sp. AFS031507]|uniref:hypothetical protein n=1 Tax=Bacillus sp. AFS031507 TaxID=2033496 RepID=UPI00211E134A|nr:hypothetical protein [Bacillus sp. AFS031507]